METREMYLKDEYEQAVKRKGEDYANAYIEGLKDGLDSYDKLNRQYKFAFAKIFETYELAKISDDRFANYSDSIYNKMKDIIDKHNELKLFFTVRGRAF